MNKQTERAKKIQRAIELTYSSLVSHLPYCHKNAKDGSKKFHKECVKEYAEIITILADLY